MSDARQAAMALKGWVWVLDDGTLEHKLIGSRLLTTVRAVWMLLPLRGDIQVTYAALRHPWLVEVRAFDGVAEFRVPNARFGEDKVVALPEDDREMKVFTQLDEAMDFAESLSSVHFGELAKWFAVTGKVAP